MSGQSYCDPEVWKTSMELAERCYRSTKDFPKEEQFGLTCQIRRSAVSVPSNIAEGQGRQHVREFLHFLGVARGSLRELETQLILSQRVGLLQESSAAPLLDLADRVGRMLTKLRQSLESKA